MIVKFYWNTQVVCEYMFENISNSMSYYICINNNHSLELIFFIKLSKSNEA